MTPGHHIAAGQRAGRLLERHRFPLRRVDVLLQCAGIARLAGQLLPWYVDLASPIYVETLARLVRQASEVKLSEMLPAIDQTWLTDAAGQTYTSELRMAVAKALCAHAIEILGLREERLNVEFTQHSGDEMYHPALGGYSPEWRPDEA